MSDTTPLVAPEAAPSVESVSSVDPADKAAPPAEGASQDSPPDQAGETEEQKPKPKRPASERISELYARTKSAERERDALARELERYKQPLVSQDQWDQLSFDQQQQLQMRQAVREERAAEIAQAAQLREAEAQQARGALFQERLSAVAEKTPEVAEAVLDPTLPVSDIGARFITESENGPQVAYWLSQNRADAFRISRMDAVSQAFELGRIEARISAAPAARKVSNAPSPPPKVNGGAGAGAKDPASMSMEEYATWRKSAR